MAAALATTATAFQIVSGVCDTNSLLGTNDSLLKGKGLIPSSNEHLIAVIFANLKQTGDVLEVLSKMVDDRGTDEHKNQYNFIYLEYMRQVQLKKSQLWNCVIIHSQRQSQRWKALEAKQGSSSSKTWLTVLRLDFLDSKGKLLRALRDDVIDNRNHVEKTSKDIRDTLMNIGRVSIFPSSVVGLDTPATKAPIVSVKPIKPTRDRPAEVQFFKVVSSKAINRSSEKDSSSTGVAASGAPLHRVDSTESWYACEMQGAVPLKKWTKELSDVLATNSPLPCGI
ncbi:hypothetical protein D9757_011453 [Collybiopsis confluens]|uniref:Uncharacterized protein n=1 Tax=Collybiopsis confluens TaxID=2823264 RepID=A0A8H5GKC5_9AGAR|nr:hypothetical protein D9757_011453 [Collybiopsis confluens]